MIRPDTKQYLEGVGLRIVARAQQLCPVVTSRLRDSIEITELTDEFVTVGSLCPYAVFVEYGTEKMSPRFFLRQAIQEVMGQ